QDDRGGVYFTAALSFTGCLIEDAMTRFAKVAFCLFASVLPVSAIAQDAATPSDPAPRGPIKLNVVVTPSSGEPVANLQQSAFTLLDNGQPQPLAAFRAVTGTQDPVKMLFVIDAVNINFTRLSYERSQIGAFLKANNGVLAEPSALAIVSDTSTETMPNFTTDGNALSKVLDDKVIGLRELRRDSGFYGAEDRLDISLKAFRGLVAQFSATPGRKAMVWISPGWPLLSGPSVQLSGKQEQGIFQEVVNLSTAMRQGNITLYNVDPLGAGQGPLSTFYYENFLKGARKPGDVLPGNLGVQVLAVQSGGLVLTSSNDVKALLQRCVDDTRASYEIAFKPSPADAPNQFHRIEVKVAEPHLTARTRQGYYAQP
ncbi:MAG: VWA domain-containing protein, partial [Janthinobacterium lividum]